MAEQPTAEQENNTNGGFIDSLKKLKEKFVPGFKYGLLISLVFNFAMLVIGCLNVHKCPVEKKIPLFLIALGAIGLMSKFVSYLRDRILKQFHKVKYVESALYTGEFVFLILGTYWVYKEFQPSYDSSDKNYCNKTAYMFAFIYLTVTYALIIVILLGFACFLLCLYLITKNTENEQRNEILAGNAARDVEAQRDHHNPDEPLRNGISNNH